VWGSEFKTKDAALQEGVPFPAAPLVMRRRCLIVVPWPRGATHVLAHGVQAVARGAARCALHVHGRGDRADACSRSFAMLSTQDSAVGLRLRLVVPRPMPAAVASRWCRRRFQQLACA
jgi:hypothetical protein